MSSDKLEVGRVGRAHGVRGQVRVELHHPSSVALDGKKSLEIELPSGGARTLDLVSAARAGKAWLVKFAGVNDRDAAQALTGSRVLVARADLPPLEDGEAYLVDLLGAEVVAPDGVVGKVIEVAVHPSVDTLVIETPDGKHVELAMLPAFVARLDVAARRIELANRDGLIE
ncbi:MAG: ribosome maturation factor RimM [Polyangiaceae bacterium]